MMRTSWLTKVKGKTCIALVMWEFPTIPTLEQFEFELLDRSGDVDVYLEAHIGEQLTREMHMEFLNHLQSIILEHRLNQTDEARFY